MSSGKCAACGNSYYQKYSFQKFCSYACELPHRKIRDVEIQDKPIKTKISKISKNNTYKTSKGKISARLLENLIHKAKTQKIQEMEDEHGYIFCEDCAENPPTEKVNPSDLKRLDCSHNISVDEAKKSGKAELCYDVKNITIRCRHHHKIHDKTN